MISLRDTNQSPLINHTSLNNINKNMKSYALNILVLEDGYNTDYIYSIITALFYSSSDGVNKILNYDSNNSNTYYIQEFIKYKLIMPIHRNMSIESETINKFRVFLYNCGWLKNTSNNILDKVNLVDFFKFIIVNMLEYKFIISKIDIINNISKDYKYDMIHLTDEHLFTGVSDPKIINLSTMVDRWIQKILLCPIKSKIVK